MGRLLILGAGQYRLVAKDVAEAMNCFAQIDLPDDHSENTIGKLNDIENIEYDAAFVAIGNPAVRSQWLQKIDRLATLIHPKAAISPSAIIGEGTIVMANAVIGYNATVGECCQLKYNCTISENCVVPDKTKVDCNVVFRDKTAINEMNKQFVETEIKRNGVEPSCF